MTYEYLCLLLVISVLVNAILLSVVLFPSYSDSNIEAIKYLTRSHLS